MTDQAIQVDQVTKSYGQVKVLKGVDLHVGRGEVVALLGDNGAGKSTLVKAIAGVHRPDSGTISVNGKPTVMRSESVAQALGIETVYQDLALAPELDCASNFYLGRELRRPGVLGLARFLDAARMSKNTAKSLQGLGIELPRPSTPVRQLSGGQRQAVAIARAAHWAEHAVLLDEPTAALGVEQSKRVMDVIRRVRDRGQAVLLISHNMPQVFEIADRVAVLFQGRITLSKKTTEVTVREVVAAIVGARDGDAE